MNGTVVSCFEGSSSTESVATTTIQIIDPRQFGKIPQLWKGCTGYIVYGDDPQSMSIYTVQCT